MPYQAQSTASARHHSASREERSFPPIPFLYGTFGRWEPIVKVFICAYDLRRNPRRDIGQLAPPEMPSSDALSFEGESERQKGI